MFFRNLINWILGFMLLNLDFKYSQSNDKQPPPWFFTDKRSRNHTTGLLQLWKATLKCNSTPEVFHYTYLNELLTKKKHCFYYSHIRRPSIRSYRVLFILTRQCRHYLHPSKSVCYRLSSRVSAYSLFVQWPQNSQTFTYQPGSLVNVHSLFLTLQLSCLFYQIAWAC